MGEIHLTEIFDTEYHKIFSEDLSQLGFKAIKDSDIYVRCVNDELLHLIYIISIGSPSADLYSFTIGASVRSVYMGNISKKELKKSKYSIYDFLCDAEKPFIPWQSYCYVCNKSNVSEVIQKALSDTMKLIIPVFDRITSISDYIEYCLATDQADLSFSPHSKEFLVWVKAADVLDYDRLAKALAGYNAAIPENCRYIAQIAVDMKKEYLLEKYIDPLNRILNDPTELNVQMDALQKNKNNVHRFLQRNL